MTNIAKLNSHNHILSIRDVGLRLFRRRGIIGRRSTYHWVLDSVTFDVEKGEVLGIIGRNGSGKSTLLRILARIIEPDRGKVINYGAKIAMLGLKTGFISELSGRENAVLSGMLLGHSRKQMNEMLPRIVEFSELDDWIDDPISIYSSGMRARLGFSVAINASADVILIDETLGVGDVGFKKKSEAAMQEMLNSDRTVILVSNSPGAIRNVADRALWLEGGKIVMQGDPEDVNEAYITFLEYMKELRNEGYRKQELPQLALERVFSSDARMKVEESPYGDVADL